MHRATAMSAKQGEIMKNSFAVIGLIIHSGKILSISRKTNHNDFSLPGGKIDPGETPEQALVRELQEEVNITPIEYVPIFDQIDHTVNKPCRTYHIKSYSGKPKSLEGSIMTWLTPEELIKSNCTFNVYNKELFEKLGLL